MLFASQTGTAQEIARNIQACTPASPFVSGLLHKNLSARMHEPRRIASRQDPRLAKRHLSNINPQSLPRSCVTPLVRVPFAAAF